MTKEQAILNAILEKLWDIEARHPEMGEEFKKLYHIMEFGPPGSNDDLE